MIIDVHAHLGVDRVFEEVRNEEEITGVMEANGVDVTIVQPMFGTIDTECIRGDHDRIYNLTRKNPKRIFGMASVNPHIKKEFYKSELKRCVNELGFVGVKLHTLAHACSPLSQDGKLVWETASELGIPVMVHTGAGIPFSIPSAVIPRAKEFPDVKVVLAHSGMLILADEAVIAASECPNVYLETSWTPVHVIDKFIQLFGAGRVMFAGDEASNVPVEIAKYRSMKLSEEQLEFCLSKTAAGVFDIKL